MNDQNPYTPGESSRLPEEVSVLAGEDLQQLQNVWDIAAGAQLTLQSVEIDQERFDRMRREVLQTTRTPHPRYAKDRKPKRRINQKVFKLAVVCTISILAVGYWWFQPVVHHAPWGEQLAMQLPDGSEVLLNSGSRLTHLRSFGSESRQVTLQGEAHFDVVHDDIPFSVETFNGVITVLGTRFNIRAWDSDDIPETVVVLEEGSVLLSGRSPDDAPVILKPGELSKISNTNAPSAPVIVDINQNMAWRTGGLIFVDQKVGVVANEIERRFDVHIEILPASLREERVTLRLNEARSAREVLSTIAVTRSYELQEENGGFKLILPN